jgi:hypothetical protein
MQIVCAGTSKSKGITGESVEKHEGTGAEEIYSGNQKFRGHIFGEEALRISPTEPYCLSRPIRRGHFNISQHYPLQQVSSLHLLSCKHDFIYTCLFQLKEKNNTTFPESDIIDRHLVWICYFFGPDLTLLYYFPTF